MPRRRKTKPVKVSEPVKKYVKRVIREKKAIRTKVIEASAGGGWDTTVQFQDLTQIAVAGAGTADDPEIYRSQQQIQPLRLTLHGKAQADGGATGDNVLRLIIFRWKQDRDLNPPTTAQVFGDYATNYAYMKPFNDIDTAKGEVLWDKTYHLARAYDGAAYMPTFQQRVIRKVLYLSKLPKVTYHSNTATQGKNHIYAVWVGNNAAGTTDAVLQLHSLLHYTE